MATERLTVVRVPGNGAEDVLIGPKGHVWTATEDGSVFRLTPDGHLVERVATTGTPYAPEMLTAPVDAQGLDRYRYPPPLAPLLVPAAVLIGWSRVALGVHYPGDVLAGILVAAGSAYLVHKVDFLSRPLVAIVNTVESRIRSSLSVRE